MKASELRIGNLVINNRNGKVCEVESLEYEGDTIYVNRDHGWGGEVDYSGCDIAPIPLSEEWLIKFRGEKNDEEGQNDYWLGPMHIIIKDGVYYWANIEEYFSSAVPIAFVHRLQNLYYELYDSELTIKE